MDCSDDDDAVVVALKNHHHAKAASVAMLALLALGTIVFAITSGEGLRHTIPMGASLCVVSMLDLRHATSSRQ